MRITEHQFILYVADQARSAAFYRSLLQREPVLDVPGMTEFSLAPGLKLGLMPEQGIARIISGPLPRPEGAHGIPRCEWYWLVEDLEAAIRQAVSAGAREVSPASDRDWGHRVAYFADPDGHVVALAAKLH